MNFYKFLMNKEPHQNFMSSPFHLGIMDIRYIWTEEQFREGSNIIYRVRSLSYPNAICLILVNAHEYTVYMGEYELKIGEVLIVHKLGKSLLDDFIRYSS